jgi:DNA-directed RNA polymerase specialized sigma24 family protein
VADFESLSDAELVAAARAGNMEAFACLADRHRGMIVALARRLLGTDDLVADVTQEATVAALVSLGRLRSPRQFGAWYAGIALNVARRLLREVSAKPLPEEYPDHGRHRHTRPSRPSHLAVEPKRRSARTPMARD